MMTKVATKQNEKLWDKEQLVANIEKNDKGDRVMVKLVMKGKNEYVDVRTWWTDKDGNLNPGKGITLPADISSEVAMAIEEAASKSLLD